MTELVKQEFDDQGIMIINQQDESVNVLTPVETITRQSPYHQVILARAHLDPQDDFYQVGWEKGRGKLYAPSSTGLWKLMSAAGVQIVDSHPIDPTLCRRCKGANIGQLARCWECPHQYDVAHVATVAQQQPDGSWVKLTGTYELDFVALEEQLDYQEREKAERYSKGKPVNETEIGQKVKRQMIMKKRHRVALAETGAYNRALRKIMNIHGHYTTQDITKPFVIHRIYLDVRSMPKELQAQVIEESQKRVENNNKLLGQDEESWEWGELDEEEPRQIAAPAEDSDHEPEYEIDGATGEVIEGNAAEPETKPQNGHQTMPEAWQPQAAEIMNALGEMGIESLDEACEIAGVPDLSRLQGSAFGFLSMVRQKASK